MNRKVVIYILWSSIPWAGSEWYRFSFNQAGGSRLCCITIRHALLSIIIVAIPICVRGGSWTGFDCLFFTHNDC